MNFRNILYALACLSFSAILGAAIYEHVAVWPAAFSEPPRSLYMFQGPYKLNAPVFWMTIHPVTLGLMVITLIISWKTTRRKNVAITLTGYVIILLATFSFFVPELIDLTSTPYNDTVDPSLQSRGSRWVTLSLIRAGVLIMLEIVLLLGLTKSEKALATKSS
jgi:hypothetical protein